MSFNDFGNNIKPEIPTKRKWHEKTDSRVDAIKLSSILRSQIQKEIEQRTNDIHTIEENIFLTKKHLLRLKQCVVSDYYKEKNPKEYLQKLPHPAIKDTFLGKRPRSCRRNNAIENSKNYESANTEITSNAEEILPTEQKLLRTETDDVKSQSQECSKPPCYIPPKPVKVETIQPPDPRGIDSKKQLRIVVGNVSKWIASSGSGATHKWTVYTKSADPDIDIADYVNKVVFFLHASYRPNDQVTVTDPPFKLTRRGWGEFPLKARFYFKNSLNSPVDVMHVLKLDSKHTGLETFGSETTLSVWIHSPLKNEMNLLIEEPLNAELVKNDPETIQMKECSKKAMNAIVNNNHDEIQSKIKNVYPSISDIDISLEEDNIMDLIKLEEDPTLSAFFESLGDGNSSMFAGTSLESNAFVQEDPISHAQLAQSDNSICIEKDSLYEEMLDECNVVESEVVIGCDKSDTEEVIEEEIKTNMEELIKEEFNTNMNEEIRNEIKPNLKETLEEEIKANAEKLTEKDIKIDLEQVIEEEMKTEIGEVIEEEIKTDIREVIEEEIKSDIGEVIEEEIKIDIGEMIEEEINTDMGELIEEDIKTDLGEMMEEEIKNDIGEVIEEEIKTDVGEMIEEEIKTDIGEVIEEEIINGMEEVIEEEIVCDQVDSPDVEEQLERLANEQAQRGGIQVNLSNIHFENNSISKIHEPELKSDLKNKNDTFQLVLSINTLPHSSERPSVINSSSLREAKDKSVSNKRKRDESKGNVKSTIIMLQKENGEIIFRKEAKYKDCREKLSAEPKKKGNPRMNSIITTKRLILNSDIEQNPTDSKHSLSPLDNVYAKATLRGKTSNSTNSKMLNIPISNLENRTLKERHLLSKCPVQNTEIAVSWLMKMYPLVDTRAALSGFRTHHPYCAKSRDDFLNWPFPKQRAAEWMRAKTIERLLYKLPLSEKWSALEIWDWCRIRGFTPLKVNFEELEATKSQDVDYFYKQPSEEIIDYIKKCKDLKEKDIVNVLSPKDVFHPLTGVGRNADKTKMDFKYKLAPIKVETPFEPELEGLRTHVNRCQMNVSAMTAAEVVVPPDVLYPAAERMLISAFHSLAEDIIRRAHNASWIRHQDNPPPEINLEDVKCAIMSRKEFDFLLPTTTGKKERPPVTVLPNFG